jgi:hypothetical protein
MTCAALLPVTSHHRAPSPALLCAMSRTGRGGGRGGFGGRSSFGASNPPPMGLTYADIQAMSREQGALYPVRPHSPSCMFILTALRMYFVASRTPSCIDRVLRRGEAYVRPTTRLCNSFAQVCLPRDGSDQVKRHVVFRWSLSPNLTYNRARTICGQISPCACHTAQVRATGSSSAFLPSRGIRGLL